jgi:hypothetical protein
MLVTSRFYFTPGERGGVGERRGGRRAARREPAGEASRAA